MAHSQHLTGRNKLGAGVQIGQIRAQGWTLFSGDEGSGSRHVWVRPWGSISTVALGGGVG